MDRAVLESLKKIVEHLSDTAAELYAIRIELQQLNAGSRSNGGISEDGLFAIVEELKSMNDHSLSVTVIEKCSDGD